MEGTKSNLNIAAQRQESKKFQSQVAKDEAVIMASQLKKVKIVIPMQSGEDGKVFGSVTPKYISEVLEKDHNITIDKKNIKLKEPIKSLGEYDLSLIHISEPTRPY